MKLTTNCEKCNHEVEPSFEVETEPEPYGDWCTECSKGQENHLIFATYDCECGHNVREEIDKY